MQIMTLKDIHSRSYVQSSITPQNILVAPLTPGQVTNHLHFFDFSCTRLYRDLQTYAHVPFRSGHALPLSGVFPFASVNFHLGNQLSRRDDLESAAYILIYLACGSLPWMDHHFTSHDDVLHWKRSIPIAQICNNLPPAFATFLAYSRNLSFTQKPDYEQALSFFQSLRTDDLTDSQPVLSLSAELAERTYWKQVSVAVRPVTVGCTPRKRQRPHNAKCATPLLKRYACYFRHG